MVKLIFQHTSSIGLRFKKCKREVMDRKPGSVETEYGEIDVKHVLYGDIKKFSIEYESAKEAAIRNGCTLDNVYRAVFRRLD